MTILFATSSFGGGGITSYAKEVISCFSMVNNLHVMIGDDKNNPITEENVIVHHLDCTDLCLPNLLKAIDLINNQIRPDIILSSNANVIPVISKYLNDNIRIITVSHSLRYREADTAAIAHKYIDHIIALSNYNKLYIKSRFSISETKITSVPNFVKDYDGALELLKDKTRFTNVPIIVFPGGTSGSKSPDIVLKIVLELIKTNLDFKFYWLGNFSSNSGKYPFLNINISELINDRRIVFTGRIPREQALQLINKADIFVAPSRREGSPIALLEAMRIGCIPIVADYKIANREVIVNGENGFIIGHNRINEWLERITDIIESRNKYKDIYYKSVETYQNNFTFNVWFERMEKLIYNSSSNHKKRLDIIDKVDLKNRVMRFEIQVKRCNIEMTLFETLPTMLKLRLIKSANK